LCGRFEVRGPVTLLFLQGVERVGVCSAGDGDWMASIPITTVISVLVAWLSGWEDSSLLACDGSGLVLRQAQDEDFY